MEIEQLYTINSVHKKDDKDYTTSYYYDSNNNLIGIKVHGTVLYFYYDSEGNATSFSHNGTKYYYVKNLQGDVVKIINHLGNVVVTYTYDAWGKILNQTDSTVYNLANINPFRYRGYVYDNETGLYYLQSRYYDPITGRFINADETAFLGATGTVLSSNLFAYCENNTVNNTDPFGYFKIRRWMISTPIDIILMLIPGIGAAFAPVKSVAKAFGKAALKTKLKTPLVSFIKFIAKNAAKLIKGFKKIVSKIPGVGKWLASKIPINKFVNMIAGATSSAIINKFLNIVIKNIDIVLSIGGAISSALDYVFDKKLDNVIWRF